MKNNQIIESFGIHLTLDGYGVSETKLFDMKRVFKVLDDLPYMLNMKKLTTPYVVDAPPVTPKDQGGISGFVMIAESHISIHTFPDKGFLTADVYSCKAFDTEKALEFFKKNFDLQDMEVNIIKRGLKFPMPEQTFVPANPIPAVSFQ